MSTSNGHENRGSLSGTMHAPLRLYAWRARNERARMGQCPSMAGPMLTSARLVVALAGVDVPRVKPLPSIPVVPLAGLFLPVLRAPGPHPEGNGLDAAGSLRRQ